MKHATMVILGSLLLACTASSDDADTMSLGTVDTVKPAVDSGAAAATIGATTTAVTPPNKSKTTAATQSNTVTKTPPVDTTNIGRDRAIQPNTKDPRFRLPVVDTTKKPPAGE